MQDYEVTIPEKNSGGVCKYPSIKVCIAKEYGVAAKARIDTLAGLNYVFVTEQKHDIQIEACLSDLLSIGEVNQLKDAIERICKEVVGETKKDDEDRKALKRRIRRVAGEECKPERHPILDQHWEQCESLSITSSDGTYVAWHGVWGDQVVLFPDLLRGVVGHIEQIRTNSHDRIGEILGKMGIEVETKER